MSINIVKEKSPKTPKSKLRIPPNVEYPIEEVKEKKVRKVKAKKATEPTEQELKEQSLMGQEDTPVLEPVLEPVVSEVPAPVVAETPPESDLELFKKLSKKIYKEKRDAKLKALTPEELEAKRAIARQKNKDYRANNKDKIKAKDKKYATEKAPIIKQKRLAKLKDPEAKAAYNEQQRLYKAKMRAEAKASAEPKPPKETKISMTSQLGLIRDLVIHADELTAEQKLEHLTNMLK